MNRLEEREERLRVLTNEIATQEIDPTCYGMYCTMGGNLPVAGGGFLWFKHYADFLEMVRNLAYFYVNPPKAETNHAIWEDINPIVDQLQAGSITLEKARLEINNLLATILVRVDWWGTPNDLGQSVDPFAQNIRESFWYDQTEEEKTLPIPEELMAEFVVWVGNYV